MKKIFSGFKDEQDGAIAIEACISLTLFLIVMIALYSKGKRYKKIKKNDVELEKKKIRRNKR